MSETLEADQASPAEQPLEDALEATLARLAAVPVLLVASDYDGTLSDIVEEPSLAQPRPEALVALQALSRLPNTHVAVLSGRSLGDLAGLLGRPPGVRLVGSHGSEFDVGFASQLGTPQKELREELLRALYGIAAKARGLMVEPKPAGAAFHYRQADPAAAEEAQAAIAALIDGREGVHQKRGKAVIELSVIETDKGRALELIRSQVGASAVIFLGDDVTDEDAFAVMRGPDVSVKVGPGSSRARLRLEDPEAVVRTLAQLAELRRAHFEGARAVPIECLSLLSDLRTAALVTPDAEIVWFCPPRLDAPALFAALLGGPAAGRFSVRPADGSAPLSQRYLDGTLILETRFSGFRVVDYLDVSAGRPRQRAGRTDLVRVVEGRGRVRIEFAPRLDFGRQATHLESIPDGLRVSAAPDGLVLRAAGVSFSIENEGAHHLGVAEFELNGAPLVIELSYGAAGPRQSPQREVQRRQESTDWWRRWSERLKLPRARRELVLRSALTLRGLCHGPTGAIAAAATTSLPEGLGGSRNWDYRFCWPRDASMAAASLARLGSFGEGLALLDWLLGVLEDSPSPECLRPIYLLSGHELWHEAEIPELVGYASSRPVRVGNAAAGQVQLDVFGPIVELVHVLAEAGAPLSAAHWKLVVQMVEAVERRWQEPDHGIWELRGDLQHHVHSKAMCWLCVDRAEKLAENTFGEPHREWRALADRIRAQVLEQGFHAGVGAFTTAYGVPDLDAAALALGLSGLVSPEDPRFLSTVEAIDRELRRGSTVLRYRFDDGLPGREGGFHLLTAWLGQAYLRLGRPERARELLEALCSLTGPTGLLSEQYDPERGIALGNHPQAYSHLGLIDLALELDAAGY